MSNYEKQNFQQGQILTAAQLNHIEEGIEKVLPLIEDDGTNKILALDKNGTLIWKDEDYGWTIEEQLLCPEIELTSNSSATYLLLPEENDPVTAYLDDEIFTGNISRVPAGYLVARLTNGTNWLTLMRIEPGVENSILNPSSLTGHLRIMVKTKKYSKLDYKYLPICSIEGEAYHSINLNNSEMAKAAGVLSVAANYGKAQALGTFAVNSGIASNLWSFAQGSNSQAKGLYSHAEGQSTIASGTAQHTEGKYNIEDVENKYVHIIGNGTSYFDKDQNKNIITRSNAHTLDWSGNAWFAGTMEGASVIVKSSTEGSNRRFKITVDDNGTISATEVTA